MKSISASVVMAALLYFMLRFFSGIMLKTRIYNAGLTVLLLFAGIFIFFFMNLILKNKDVLELKKMFVRKRPGK